MTPDEEARAKIKEALYGFASACISYGSTAVFDEPDVGEQERWIESVSSGLLVRLESLGLVLKVEGQLPKNPSGGSLIQWRQEQSERVELEIRVPELPPSPNQASNVSYVNRSREKKFGMLVEVCAMSARNQWEREHHSRWIMLEQAEIEIRFVVADWSRRRLPDYGNCLRNTKAAVDGLHNRMRGGVRRHQDGTFTDTRRQGVGLFQDDDKRMTWQTPPEDLQVVKEGYQDLTIIYIRGKHG